MARMSAELLIQSLQWRYATQRFDRDKKISKEDLGILLDSTKLAPSSYGLEPFQFLIVENQDIRQQLRKASWNQSQITDASHLIVFTTLKKIRAEHVDEYLDRIVKIRGISKDTLRGFEATMKKDFIQGPRASIVQPWTQRQAYLSMGFLMMAAALLEIDSCPMEGLETIKYDEILGLTESDYSVVSAVTLGYRSSEDPYQNFKKVRKSDNELYRFIK